MIKLLNSHGKRLFLNAFNVGRDYTESVSYQMQSSEIFIASYFRRYVERRVIDFIRWIFFGEYSTPIFR